MQEIQEALEGITTAMQFAKVSNDITENWKVKAAHFIAINNLFTKPHLIEQVVRICEEAAMGEIQVYINYINKINAIIELDNLKQETQNTENQEIGVH